MVVLKSKLKRRRRFKESKKKIIIDRWHSFVVIPLTTIYFTYVISDFESFAELYFMLYLFISFY